MILARRHAPSRIWSIAAIDAWWSATRKPGGAGGDTRERPAGRLHDAPPPGRAAGAAEHLCSRGSAALHGAEPGSVSRAGPICRRRARGGTAAIASDDRSRNTTMKNTKAVSVPDYVSGAFGKGSTLPASGRARGLHIPLSGLPSPTEAAVPIAHPISPEIPWWSGPPSYPISPDARRTLCPRPKAFSGRNIGNARMLPAVAFGTRRTAANRKIFGRSEPTVLTRNVPGG
jgi:hypothetical protein